MRAKSTLWILFSIYIQRVCLQDDSYDYEDEAYEDQQPLNCSTTESIKNGHVSYSQEGLQRSVLTYHCGPAQYPHPVRNRVCGADGEWSTMTLSNGRPAFRATCKDVLCPAQLQLDNGNFWPRNQWFRVNMTQSFSCQEGFTLHGSAHRNCTLSGDWTGDTPICDNHADDCDDPGIPPGSERSAGLFHQGEKVIYRCQSGLMLLGSAERVCLENREWSGSTPRCQGPNTFDSPRFVAAALAGSLAGVMDVFSPDSKKRREVFSFGRAFRVAEVGQMNIFILLDTSGSIQKKDFEVSRNATVALIRKLDSYDVQLNFHVLSFASEVKVIVDIIQTDVSSDTDEVIDLLMEFSYHSHGRKTGTNLYSALLNVNERIGLLKINSVKNRFNETQNIIIIETDGYSNTGKKPELALAQIRHILGYDSTSHDNTNEKMLDVYVFGIGDKVKKEELNLLASKKTDEQHLFILKDFQTLGNVFNSIISDQSVTMCGIAQEDISKDLLDASVKVYTKPWHVTLASPEWGDKKYCSGSILSQNWVLTAAHCFTNKRVPKKLTILHGGGEVNVDKVIIHSDYGIRNLSQRNVSEFYDYDVALVHTNSSIPLSWTARPICLPCTIPASRAMKRINSTCEDHRKELLAYEKTPAFFTHKKQERKQTHIHTQTQRTACVEKARTLLKQPTDVTLEEFVTERFLCTGGTEGYQDAISCKGDSGGPLFLQKRKRYFQVGVVSWGITDICELSAHGLYSSSTPPPNARDFHISVFEIMPWLKTHLAAHIQFLPDIKNLTNRMG